MAQEQSFQEQVAQVVAKEKHHLKMARAVQLEIAETEKKLVALRVQAQDEDLILTKLQHFLDGVGLGQRYQAEITAQAMIAKEDAAPLDSEH